MTGPNIFRFYNSARIYSPAARIRQQFIHRFSVKIPANSRSQIELIFCSYVRKKIKTVLMFLFSEFNTCWASTHCWGKAQILCLYVQKYQMRITKSDILFPYQKTHQPRWYVRWQHPSLINWWMCISELLQMLISWNLSSSSDWSFCQTARTLAYLYS